MSYFHICHLYALMRIAINFEAQPMTTGNGSAVMEATREFIKYSDSVKQYKHFC